MFGFASWVKQHMKLVLRATLGTLPEDVLTRVTTASFVVLVAWQLSSHSERMPLLSFQPKEWPEKMDCRTESRERRSSSGWELSSSSESECWFRISSEPKHNIILFMGQTLVLRQQFYSFFFLAVWDTLSCCASVKYLAM